MVTPEPYPNRDAFTGSCMKGGSAKTQGNEYLLIPIPKLPPCAGAICGVSACPESAYSVVQEARCLGCVGTSWKRREARWSSNDE